MRRRILDMCEWCVTLTPIDTQRATRQPDRAGPPPSSLWWRAYTIMVVRVIGRRNFGPRFFVSYHAIYETLIEVWSGREGGEREKKKTVDGKGTEGFRAHAERPCIIVHASSLDMQARSIRAPLCVYVCVTVYINLHICACIHTRTHMYTRGNGLAHKSNFCISGVDSCPLLRSLIAWRHTLRTGNIRWPAVPFFFLVHVCVCFVLLTPRTYSTCTANLCRNIRIRAYVSALMMPRSNNVAHETEHWTVGRRWRSYERLAVVAYRFNNVEILDSLDHRRYWQDQSCLFYVVLLENYPLVGTGIRIILFTRFFQSIYTVKF